MLDLKMRRIVVTLILVLSGCASIPSPQALHGEWNQSGTADADSTENAEYDIMFVDIHYRLVDEIGLRHDDGRDPTLIEIRAIVKIAEDLYLQGNILLAIKLLTEAELLLRQIP